MARKQQRSLIVALLMLGCASGPKLDPASQAAPGKDERPAAELVARGREAAARGDAVRAEQYLSFAIEQGADRRETMPLLLKSCLQSSHLRAALNHAEPYLLEHPEDDALRYLVATIHLGLGQPVRARRELGLLLQKNSQDPNAHYLFGIIESATNTEAARAHFVATIEHTRDEEQRIEVQSRLSELRLREAEFARDTHELPRSGGGEP